ncbi:hypothetical protein [Bacteroides caecimuris]|uniref:hypothetical protein n=1 Tax=Bacteroides caecimuris TaxID=1796613 RepID=UPI001C3D08FB|nr:hypothetical protein [Bacteroides caecimuris]
MKVTHPIKTNEGDEYLVLIESMAMATLFYKEDIAFLNGIELVEITLERVSGSDISVCMHLLIDDYAIKVSCIALTNLILALVTLSYMLYTSGNGKPKQLTEQKADKQQKRLSKKVGSIIILLFQEEGN